MIEADDTSRGPLLTDWIIVRNWERFQHYHDRSPIWIKLYTSLLRDPQYLDLSMGARGLLHTIWMLFAVEKGTIRVQDVSHFVHKRISKVQLVSLNHAGFIDFSASKPLALEVEVEIEKESSWATPVDNSAGLPVTIETRTREPDLLNEAYNIVLDWPGGPSEDLDNLLDDLERKRRRQLSLSQRHKLWDIALARTSNNNNPPGLERLKELLRESQDRT
jgi:hypothetical protein